MVGKEQNEGTSEAINREQQDEGQAQDVAYDALHPETGRGSVRGGRPDPTRILPEDAPDLVEKMEQMVSSGRIDNGAYAGEPQHDDEEDMLGETENIDEDMLLSDELGSLADDGEDPLANVASRHGLEDEDNGDDDDDYDNADDLVDDLDDDELEDDEFDEDEDDEDEDDEDEDDEDY